MTFDLSINSGKFFSRDKHKISKPAAQYIAVQDSEKLVHNLNNKINITEDAFLSMKRFTHSEGVGLGLNNSLKFQNFIVENTKVISKRLAQMGHKVNGKLTLSGKNIKDVLSIVKALKK